MVVPLQIVVVPVIEVGAVEDEFTIIVTSFEITALPQVGVDVLTIYHVPTPKLAPVGVYVCPVAPDMLLIEPKEVERFPHWRLVIAPPSVSVADNWVPVPVEQIF